MSVSRPLVALLTVGVLGVATVGVGAGATFTQAVRSTQTITAGTMNVTVSGPGSVSSDGKSITLPAPAAVGSTFETARQVVTVTNNGNIPVHSVRIGMTESHNLGSAASNALAAQMNVCIQSTDYSGGPWTEGNGPLAAAVALGVDQNPVVLNPGQSLTFWATFYAGKDSSNCSATHSDGTNTRAAWNGYLGGAYTTPAALTDAAQGGVVTPTLVFSFEG
jgi:hypothetical protein